MIKKLIMKQITIEDVKNSDSLLYHYIRGSHAYGLQKPDGTSDIDTAMVYLEPVEQLLGLGLDYQQQVSDKKGDNIAYSLKRFLNLALTSNPTVLESLFIPKRCILYEHPIMKEIKKHRDKFITKACFKPFLGYAYEQINKCRSLNKKFLLEEVARKEPLDFTYTFRNQGSTKILNWLEHRGMKQKYCGLVNIPNMDCMYALFYDWGSHFINEDVTYEGLVIAYKNTHEDETVDIIHTLKNCETLVEKERKELEDKLHNVQLGNMTRFIEKFYLGGDGGFHDIPLHWNSILRKWFDGQKRLGYKGLVNEDGSSNELKLSSVKKGEVPICHIHYNKDKYSSHCKDYKSFIEWKENRNPERYKENCGKQFDRKNVAHAVRLLHMGIEIAKGEGFNVDRTNIDRDFILNIRLGNTSYEEILGYIESKKDEMYELMKTSQLPDSIDVEFVNNMLLNIRKQQFENYSFKNFAI